MDKWINFEKNVSKNKKEIVFEANTKIHCAHI